MKSTVTYCAMAWTMFREPVHLLVAMNRFSSSVCTLRIPRVSPHMLLAAIIVLVAALGAQAAGAAASPPQPSAKAASTMRAAPPGAPRIPKSIDVNSASAAELEQVRGIGPALAARIVSVRHQGGRFRDSDELRQRVRGIGDNNLRRMVAAGLSVDGPVRVDAMKAANRERVDLIVGNSPPKGDGRGAGRVEEIACCGSVPQPQKTSAAEQPNSKRR